MKPIQRCPWGTNEQMIAYHDEEWGVSQHDDNVLFEFLVLEGAQAGLSWSTILAKRAAYRKAFSNFNPRKVAKYAPEKVRNARALLAVQKEFGSFDRYIWQFVEGKPLTNRWRSMDRLPAQTPESVRMSKDLLKRGFSFAGPTVCYAFMQAVGMVNDHLVSCFRYSEIREQVTSR